MFKDELFDIYKQASVDPVHFKIDIVLDELRKRVQPNCKFIDIKSNDRLFHLIADDENVYQYLLNEGLRFQYHNGTNLPGSVATMKIHFTND